MSAILVTLVFPTLVALAGGWDIASYTIPNKLTLALCALFVLFAVVAGVSVGALGLHLAAGLLGLVVGFGMFAAGWIGGGDAKLFAATAMWFGFSDLLDYALIAAVLGGGMTLLILMMRQVPLPAGLIGRPWIARLHHPRSGIPYGAALAAGALVQLPHAEIFRMAGLA